MRVWPMSLMPASSASTSALAAAAASWDRAGGGAWRVKPASAAHSREGKEREAEEEGGEGEEEGEGGRGGEEAEASRDARGTGSFKCKCITPSGESSCFSRGGGLAKHEE